MDIQQFGVKMSIEKGQKKDRRIQYTRNVLGQTLVQLLHSKPIEKISITEICKLADINRATFYLHYHSPYELLSEIQETFYASFKQDLEQLLRKEAKDRTRLDDLFKEASSDEAKRRDELERRLQRAKEEAKRDPQERPRNPFDLD